MKLNVTTTLASAAPSGGRTTWPVALMITAALALVACKKPATDTAPDAGIAATTADLDAATVVDAATGDDSGLDPLADAGDDAGIPTDDTYDKQAAAAVSNLAAAKAALDELDREISN